MGINLQDHQLEAYEEVKKIYRNSNRASVIFPTGCGKSFIALKLLEDNPGKKVLYLTPGVEIKNQFKRYIEKFIGKPWNKVMPNLDMVLYQGLSMMSDEKLKELKPDIIVLDEAHRAGGNNKWGKTIQRLLELNPNAKVLGLTATPERGDKVNIVDSLFKGNIASEITLIEAIERGIVKSPRYVTTIYSYKEDLDRISLMMEECDDPKEKEELKKKYNQAKKMLEKAEGLDELFSKNITCKDGKYIVFCKDIKHMEEMMSKAKELFAGVDQEPEIYGIASKYGKRYNNDQIKRFDSSNSGHLKLLFTVKMLDEGVHLEKIKGVVLLSEVKSRIVFLQRIGRAFSSDKDAESPLIIDTKNSYLYHNIFKDINERIVERRKRKKLAKRRKESEESQIDEFEVDSREEEFVSLMSVMNEKLNSSKYFEKVFGQVERFAEEHKRLPIENERVNLKERKLAQKFRFLKNRTIGANRYKQESELDEDTRDRIRRIKELERKYDKEWQIIDEQLEFVRKNKRLSLSGPDRSKDERSIAKKYIRLRKKLYKTYKEYLNSEDDELDEYEIDSLIDKIQAIENVEKIFETQWKVIFEVEEFCIRNKRLPSGGKNREKEERLLSDKYVKLKLYLSSKKNELGENTPKGILDKIEKIKSLERMYNRQWKIINDVRLFCEQNKRFPKQNEQEKQEDYLAGKYSNLKSTLFANISDNVFVLDKIEAIKELEKTYAKEWQVIKRTLEFCDQYDRLPSLAKSKSQEEIDIATDYQNLKSRLVAREKKKKLNGEELRHEDAELLQEIRRIQRKYDYHWQIISRVTEFVDKNGRLPNKKNKENDGLGVLYSSLKDRLKYTKIKIEEVDEETKEKILAIRRLERRCDHQWKIIEQVEEFATENNRLPHSTKDTPEQEKKIYGIYLQLTKRIINNIRMREYSFDTSEKAIRILKLAKKYGARLTDRELEKVILESELIRAEELEKMYLEMARESGITLDEINGESLNDE